MATQTAATDAGSTPKPPPNLRVAEDENRECDNCTYYSRGRCTQYSNLPVDGEWVCDTWKQGSESGADDTEDKPFDGKNLKEADAEARVRVREHFRRARQQAAQK